LLAAKPDKVSTYRLFVTVPSATASEPVKSFDVVLTDQASDESFSFETIFRGPK
jgi:hypothetical protein